MSGTRVLMGSRLYDVVTSHSFDSGGMFRSSAGVHTDDGGFRAFVKDGWGGGIHSKLHATQAEAEVDVPRLKEKFYG